MPPAIIKAGTTIPTTKLISFFITFPFEKVCFVNIPDAKMSIQETAKDETYY
jgi:hypothetical protein